jgi:DNA gyrase subunit A
MNVAGISRIGRATQGVRVIQTSDDDEVVSAIRTAEGDEPESEIAAIDAPPAEETTDPVAPDDSGDAADLDRPPEEPTE